MPTDNLVIKRHFTGKPERVFAAFTEKNPDAGTVWPGSGDRPPLRGRRAHRRKIPRRNARAVGLGAHCRRRIQGNPPAGPPRLHMGMAQRGRPRPGSWS